MLCQTVPVAFMVPVTWSPPVVTLTLPSLPRAAVTVMPWPGWAVRLPFAGVMDTARPEGVWVAAGLPPDDAVLLLPPEQAVMARLSAPQIAATAIHRNLRAGEGPVAPTSGPPVRLA